MKLKTKWLPEDIRSLILHFLDRRKDIHPDALDILSWNDWGFSIRKIMDFVDDIVASAGYHTITPEDLPFEVFMNGILNGVLGGDIQSYNEAKRRITDKFDRIIITKYLTKYGCNATRATEELKLDRPISSGYRGNTILSLRG